jgi:hypothetical protein
MHRRGPGWLVVEETIQHIALDAVQPSLLIGDQAERHQFRADLV